MITTVIVLTAPPPGLVALLVGGEDSLKFSFEATSIVGEVLGDHAPSESSTVGPVA